jgi:hypothetical protein
MMSMLQGRWCVWSLKFNPNQPHTAALTDDRPQFSGIHYPWLFHVSRANVISSISPKLLTPHNARADNFLQLANHWPGWQCELPPKVPGQQRCSQMLAVCPRSGRKATHSLQCYTEFKAQKIK